MKKKLVILCAAVLLICAGFSAVNAAGTASANPSGHSIYVDGKEMSVAVYEIGGSNYFKLRDLAKVLNGTQKQFDVGWNQQLQTIELNQETGYSGGDENGGAVSGTKQAAPSGAKVVLNGTTLNFTAYNIDGNNYFKLRDIAEAMDFGIGWDDTAKRVDIIPTETYDGQPAGGSEGEKSQENKGTDNPAGNSSGTSDRYIPRLAELREPQADSEKEIVTVTIKGTVVGTTSSNVEYYGIERTKRPQSKAKVELIWIEDEKVLAEAATNDKGEYSLSFEIEKWTLDNIYSKSGIFELRANSNGFSNVFRHTERGAYYYLTEQEGLTWEKEIWVYNEIDYMFKYEDPFK